MSPSNTDAVARVVQADGSGYRAAGLCADEHASGTRCTRSAADHHGPGSHGNPYVRQGPADAIGLRW
ncbi:hypothetical protein ACIQVK_25200 [Streptomyces sp. NPDC090493]|uniref:hypothetical protein n=1 Tax=Streptomyces sp. NPDC090493 TaxID=3365964 RepID=UPI00381EC0D7